MRYILVLFVFMMFSCQPKETISTIDVKIEGAKADDKITVYGPGYEQEFNLEDGVLYDTLMIDKAGVFSIVYGRNSVQTYAEPGANISFSGDASNFDKSASFIGDQQTIWEYYKGKSAIQRSILNNRVLMRKNPADFISAVDIGNDSLRMLLSNSTLPTSLKTMEEEAIELGKQRRLFIYPAYANKDIATLPIEFQDPLKGTALDNEEKYLYSQAYKQIVNDHFSLTMYRDTTGEYEEVFMKHISALPAGNIRNQLLYNDMRYLLGPNDKMEEMYTFFNENSSDSKHKMELEKKYASLQSLKKGEKSPAFDYENHKGGTSKLADYRGKYVYVDVWATWCGPCKAEIPSLKEKEKKYAGRDVEFVSISIDEKKAYDAWRKMVDDKELGGSQLIADNAWQSDFVKDYQINGIPRFILIGPDGKIVSADAPRPSSDKLDETFEKLKI